MTEPRAVTRYDPVADALYIQIAPELAGHVADTQEVAPDIMLDFDEAGRLLGIEILHVSVRIAPSSGSAG